MTSCWPTTDQELLLRACLRTGTDAVDAWRRWRSRIDLDDVDDASFRLLPLLYRTLATLREDATLETGAPLARALDDLAFRGVPRERFEAWCDRTGVKDLRSRPARWA